jgi:aldose 1-epimerase
LIGAGTPFDFTKPKAIGTDVDSANVQLKYGGGYDHNWVLNPNADANGFRPAATVYSPLTEFRWKYSPRNRASSFMAEIL